MRFTWLISGLFLTSCAVFSPTTRDANQLCERLRAEGNYSYASNNLTPETCQCTMKMVRELLPDSTWNKFIIILDGGDPFPSNDLPSLIDGEESAPQTPPELSAIEAATSQAEAACIPG